MKVIIPVAGIGSRLRPHTFTVPKSLLPVAGKPLLGHILDQVIDWGGRHFTLIVGHLRQQLEDYVQKEYLAGSDRTGISVDFREQAQMLGLGHAVLTGLDPGDKEVLIVLADTVIDGDMSPVIKRGVTSIVVKPVEDPRKFGVVLAENGKVRELIEKPQEPVSNLAIVGIYYIRDGDMLSKAVKEVIERGKTVKGEYQVTDALQVLLEWGETIETFPVEGWFDCGTPATILATHKHLFQRNGGYLGDFHLEDGRVIEPAHIADGVRIERSVVGPNVSLGAGCIVRDSIIRDSIVCDDAQIEGALLENAIIGRRAEVRGKFESLNLGASSQITY